MNKLKLEKKERNKKDKLWRQAVFEKDCGKCQICGDTDKPNAHHIINRVNRKFRWEVCNGILLCSKHHRFSFQMSAHQNPFMFYLWFFENRKEQLSALLKLLELP